MSGLFMCILSCEWSAGKMVRSHRRRKLRQYVSYREAAWSSGLGRWICNLEVPGSNPPPYCYLDLFPVVPDSTPRPRCVNIQLVSLPPVGILNSFCSI